MPLISKAKLLVSFARPYKSSDHNDNGHESGQCLSKPPSHPEKYSLGLVLPCFQLLQADRTIQNNTFQSEIGCQVKANRPNLVNVHISKMFFLSQNGAPE